MEYHCKQCGMGVKGLTCVKCDSELVTETLKFDDKSVMVSKCPKGCGKIKSPQCCGADMVAK